MLHLFIKVLYCSYVHMNREQHNQCQPGWGRLGSVISRRPWPKTQHLWFPQLCHSDLDSSGWVLWILRYISLSFSTKIFINHCSQKCRLMANNLRSGKSHVKSTDSDLFSVSFIIMPFVLNVCSQENIKKCIRNRQR